jgi:hypothetical protein
MDVMGLTSILPCRDCKLCHADRNQNLWIFAFPAFISAICRTVISSSNPSNSVEAGGRLFGQSGSIDFRGINERFYTADKTTMLISCRGNEPLVPTF